MWTLALDMHTYIWRSWELGRERTVEIAQWVKVLAFDSLNPQCRKRELIPESKLTSCWHVYACMCEHTHTQWEERLRQKEGWSSVLEFSSMCQALNPSTGEGIKYYLQTVWSPLWLLSSVSPFIARKPQALPDEWDCVSQALLTKSSW